uniref:Methyltransferase domain-containing protein n=1 Tax=Euplotes harpa TaxID=151035 RepID=A0A7S3JF87_9SPIT
MEETGTAEWLSEAIKPWEVLEKSKLMDIYTLTAKDYDKIVHTLGALDQLIAAESTEACVPDKSAMIFDMGCGTGIVGKHLHKIGYTNIIGVDACEAMIEEARKKECYSELEVLFLGDIDNFPEKYKNRFDVITSCGLFTEGHLGPEHCDEMILSLKSGGFAIFTMRAEYVESKGFQAKFDELTEARKWELVEAKEFMKYHNLTEEGIQQYKPQKGLCYIFKKL